MVDVTARVVNLKLCRDTHCHYRVSAPQHIIVTESRLPLQSKQAKAISYTWGEFDRQNRTIGHYENGSEAILSLGEEWLISDLVVTLSSLCDQVSSQNQQPGYCWIDQLCIRQDDATEVRDTLARIPDIYRAFDVVVLLSGARCTCISSRVDLVSRAMESEISSDELLDVLLSVNCPNDLSFLTWGQRIWPRQELLYASGLQFVWCSQSSIECPGWWADTEDEEGNRETSAPDFDKLSLVAKLWLRKMMQTQGRAKKDRAVAEHMLQYQSTTALSVYAESISLWLETHAKEALFEDFSHERFALGLLDGEKIHMEDPDKKDSDDFAKEEGLNRFLRILSDLQRSSRQATRARDYVLSVWVDCPDYEIPKNYADLSLALLLQDAVLQLERSRAVSIVTLAPAGLFGAESGSVLWRPELYLDHYEARRVGPVYATMLPLTCPILDPLGSMRLPTRAVGDGPRQKPQTPIDLKSYQSNKRSLFHLELFFYALPYWHVTVANIISHVWLPSQEKAQKSPRNATDDLCDDILGQIVIDKREKAEDAIHAARGNVNIDCYEVFQRVIGYTLGLTTESVLGAGLRVMMRPATASTPFMLGLTSCVFAKGCNMESYPLRIHICRSRENCTNDDLCENQDMPTIIYEVVDVHGSDAPTERRVIGVWTPIDLKST